MMVATTPMKHLQRTVTIPYGPFTDEEDNAIERFPHEEDTSDDEVHNPTVVGSQWNVGHKGGDYRYNAQKIIDRVFHPSINSAAAIQMLHNRNSIDFGSNGSRGRQWNRSTTSTRSFSSIFQASSVDLERPYQNW
ncbi:hypothetical protein E4U25_008299, partial [Claviceps purpurea]